MSDFINDIPDLDFKQIAESMRSCYEREKDFNTVATAVKNRALDNYIKIINVAIKKGTEDACRYAINRIFKKKSDAQELEVQIKRYEERLLNNNSNK